MIRCDELPPSPGKRVLCRHPFDEAKRAYVCPSHVEPLYHVYWKDGKVRLYILNSCTTKIAETVAVAKLANQNASIAFNFKVFE